MSSYAISILSMPYPYCPPTLTYLFEKARNVLRKRAARLR